MSNSVIGKSGGNEFNNWAGKIVENLLRDERSEDDPSALHLTGYYTDSLQ